MKNELISVIIPVYNGEKYIKSCLNSIIRQTYSNIEIIIVNDGSIDKTVEVCNNIIDDRIILLTQDNCGVSVARNYGLDNAKGKYVIFIDADDYIEENMIEILYNNIKKEDYDISICNFKIIENGNVIYNKCDEINNTDSFALNLLEPNMYKGYLWNKLIKKECIGETRFSDKIYIMEDLVFLLDISERIHKVYFAPKKYLYNYVKREDSAMNKIDERYLSINKAFKKVFKYKESMSKKLYNKYIYDYLFSNMLIYGYMHKRNKTNFIEQKEVKELRRRYMKSALESDYSIKAKVKLLFICYFPLLYEKIKNK